MGQLKGALGGKGKKKLAGSSGLGFGGKKKPGGLVGALVKKIKPRWGM